MMIISCKLPNNKMTPRLIFKRTNKKNINNENASKKTLQVDQFCTIKENYPFKYSKRTIACDGVNLIILP